MVVGSAVMFGTVADMPAGPPPAAERAAATVDDVAQLQQTATARVPLEAEAIKLGPSRVSLRGPGGVGHSRFENAPVTPVRPGTRLADVLHGTPPETAYPTPEAFELSMVRARSVQPEWRTTGSELLVRRVSYGEVNGVLVGV